MNGERVAPSSAHVVFAIARRELSIASRRKLLRLLFLMSLVPPLIFATILVVRIVAEKFTDASLDWDPVLTFIQFQCLPVALLALGLGTPSVSRDRSEEVLFLYATRPVLPWHYALGKMLAVAIPTGGLLLAPGVLIALLRQGILQEVDTLDALLMIGKLLIAALLVAWSYAGVSVGPSAAARRTRWALLLAIGLFILPASLGEAIFGDDSFPLGPPNGIARLLDTLFDGGSLVLGIGGAVILILYGTLGLFVTLSRVRREMTP